MRPHVFDVVNVTIVSLVSLVCIVPFWYVLTTSFTDPAVYIPFEFRLVPRRWSLAAYAHITSTSTFVNALRNTVGVTLVGTLLNLIFTFTLAYALTKRSLPLRRAMVGIVVFTLVFSPGIIPDYLMVIKLGLLNKYAALVLPVLTNAWSLIVVRSFMDTIPAELEQAAAIDGCNDLQVFARITIPLSMAAIAAFTLFFAVTHWNEYFRALVYLSDNSKRTLQVLVKSLVLDSQTMGVSERRSIGDEVMIPQETVRLASVVFAMAPILLVYPFLQKYFAKGVLLGSVKG